MTTELKPLYEVGERVVASVRGKEFYGEIAEVHGHVDGQHFFYDIDQDGGGIRYGVPELTLWAVAGSGDHEIRAKRSRGRLMPRGFRQHPELALQEVQMLLADAESAINAAALTAALGGLDEAAERIKRGRSLFREALGEGAA